LVTVSSVNTSSDDSQGQSLAREIHPQAELRWKAARPPDHGYRLPILVSLFASFVVLFYYLVLRYHQGTPSIWVYWGALVLTFIPGIVSRNRIAAMFGVGAFVFLQSFSYFFSAPYGFVYVADPINNMELAQLLSVTHFWVPGMGSSGSSLYSFYPGSMFYHVGIVYLTGLAPNVTLLFDTDLFRLLVLPLAFYRLLRRFVGVFPSLIGVIILYGVASTHFDLPVLQEFAYVFLVLGLYGALISPTSKKGNVMSQSALGATFVFLGALAVSHYFTSYMMLLLLGVVAVAGILRRVVARFREKRTKRGEAPRPFSSFLYVAVAYVLLFAFWSAYVSSPIDLFWFQFAGTTFIGAFSPKNTGKLGGVSSTGASVGFSYSTIELGLIGLALLILVVTTLAGAFFVFRRGRRRTHDLAQPSVVLLTLFFFALIVVAVTVPFIFTVGFYIPERILEFGAFGIAPLCGVVYAYLLLKRHLVHATVVALCLAVVVVGGSLVQTASPRFYSLAQGAQYCEAPTHLTKDVLAAGQWAEENLRPKTPIYGDELVLDGFGSYFGLNVIDDLDAFNLFNASVLDLNVTKDTGLKPGDVIVVHDSMIQSVCFAAFTATSLTASQLDKFATTPGFAEVYMNKEVTLYQWQGSG
jgi:hypothetical protein